MPADPLLIFTRAIHFAALFSLVGSALVPLYAPDAPLRGIFPQILRLSAVVAVPSGLLGLGLTLAGMAGGWDQLVDPDFLKILALETPFGAPVAARLALLLGLAVFAGWPGEGARWRLSGLGLGAGLLIDQAWLGHAAQGFGLAGAIMLAVYGLHVLAGAAWLGALAPLLASLSADRSPQKTLSQEIFGRFSRLALPVVLILLASGAQNIWFRVGWRLSRVFAGAYGAVLALKLGLVALALALAAFNRLIAVPALSRGHSRALKASLVAEIALALAILAAAATLGATPPP